MTITEYLAFLEALRAGLANCSLDDFYTLSRICLVKNETHYDRFDVAFAEYIEKARKTGWDINDISAFLPKEDNVISLAAKSVVPDVLLSEEAAGQKPVSDSDNKPDYENDPAGTANTGSPFCYMDEIPRPLDKIGVGQEENGVKTVRAWNSREFQAIDDSIELGTRHIKLALRRLRKFAREGIPAELDIDATIQSTAHHAGLLDLVMRPERKNKVKVLLLFDTGGSMSAHVKCCEELFSAARTEFKQMDYFYFHNCVYDTVWKYDGPSSTTHYSLQNLTHRFGKDYKLVFVGDATMGPTEITDPNSSFYYTPYQQSGETAMKILLAHFRHAVWLNPEQERFWTGIQSIEIIRSIMEDRMYPLTLRGLDDAMRALGK
ncbi:MAG: VWA domain-containing protein [Oxalobacter formigenes]|nr:VWA domain-containing protein [Oxalobacter formigenes]